MRRLPVLSLRDTDIETLGCCVATLWSDVGRRTTGCPECGLHYRARANNSVRTLQARTVLTASRFAQTPIPALLGKLACELPFHMDSL